MLYQKILILLNEIVKDSYIFSISTVVYNALYNGIKIQDRVVKFRQLFKSCSAHSTKKIAILKSNFNL